VNPLANLDIKNPKTFAKSFKGIYLESTPTLDHGVIQSSHFMSKFGYIKSQNFCKKFLRDFA
jgi:hypothetical protein